MAGSAAKDGGAGASFDDRFPRIAAAAKGVMSSQRRDSTSSV